MCVCIVEKIIDFMRWKYKNIHYNQFMYNGVTRKDDLKLKKRDIYFKCSSDNNISK